MNNGLEEIWKGADWI